MCEQARRGLQKRAFHKFFENLNTAKLKSIWLPNFLLLQEPIYISHIEMVLKCELWYWERRLYVKMINDVKLYFGLKWYKLTTGFFGVFQTFLKIKWQWGVKWVWQLLLVPIETHLMMICSILKKKRSKKSLKSFSIRLTHFMASIDLVKFLW